jgi:hypothetical protein
MGVHATAMERRGLQTEVGELNRSILASNDDRRSNRKGAGRKELKGSPAGERTQHDAKLLDLQRRIAERQRENELDL